VTGWLSGPGWLPVAMDIPVRIGRDEARRRALAELNKAKYGGTPPWLNDLLDRAETLLTRLLELITRLSAARQGGGISWGFVIAVLILLVALGLVIWRVGLPRWRKRGSAGAVEVDSTRPPADYRELAEEHAARGDWRSAVRDRFRAVVRELEVRTILDVRPARTAWEAAFSAARTLPTCRDELVDGAELFNGVVYGDRAADSQAYARMVDIDSAVVSAADRVDLAAEAVPV
jgi:Domain of unknown function (DUF4129)